MNIEEEIIKLQERNKKVDEDKAWETSWARRGLIACLTYTIVVLVFLSFGFPRPFLSALIPTIGFLLSTISMRIAKSMWVRHRRASL